MGWLDGPVRDPPPGANIASGWFVLAVVLGVVVSGLAGVAGAGVGGDSVVAAAVGGAAGAVAVTIGAVVWRSRDGRPRPRETAVGLACGAWVLPVVVALAELTA